MYSDKVSRRKRYIWLFPVFLLITAAFLLIASRGRDTDENGAVAIRAAVESSARQCYVVEGVYPPDLEYLEKNYGLNVNTKEFYVVYDAFASNLPPTVKVVSRK